MAKKFLSDINITAGLEANGDLGTNNQILSSTGTNVQWIDETDTFITNLSFNTGNGILTATLNDGTTVTEDLDGRYNNYTHPTFNGDDIDIDTGVLTGATVISDLDFNITTNSEGHVTDANGTISTRELTPSDIGAQPAGTYNTIIGTDSDINTSGSTIIDNIFVTDGVITSMGTRTLTLSDLGGQNYEGWDLFTDGIGRGRITPLENVEFKGGGAIDLAYSTLNNNTLTFSHADTSTLNGTYGGANNGIVIEDITLDGYGHITGVGTRDLDSRYNNYTHPTFNGDDITVDTGALSGATVISDLDFNVTTNTEGHVTDANGTVSTRNITLSDLGYTGPTNPDNYQYWNLKTNGTQRKQIQSTDNLDIAAGTNVSVGYSAGGVVTINSTDTFRGIDDTPVNGQTNESITSNWAYNHENASNPHGITKSTIGLGNVDNYSRAHYDGRYSATAHDHNGDTIYPNTVYVGDNGSSDSNMFFYDDNSNTWRTFQWDDSVNNWRVEDNAGIMRRLFHEGHTPTWGEVTGKPSTFTPSSHNHDGDTLYPVNIHLDSRIYHAGDTNTYMQFHAADQWRVVTGGAERLEVNNSVITATRRLESTVEMRAPIFRDRNNTAYYVDPASYSQFNVLDVNSQIRHRGDTDTYMQFHGADQWRVVTGGGERLEVNSFATIISSNLQIKGNGSTPDNTTNTYNEGLTITGGNMRLVIDTSDVSNGGAYIQTRHSSFSYPDVFYDLNLNPLGGNVGIGTTSPNDKLDVNGNIRANRFTDRNNTNYYVDPSSTSKIRNLDIINGNIRLDDNSIIQKDSSLSNFTILETNSNYGNQSIKQFYSALYTSGTFYAGAPNSSGSSLYANDVRANIFYERSNTSYFVHGDSVGDSIRVAGDIVAFYSSDRRYKDNIKPIQNPIEKINKIGGYTFNWNEESHKETGKKDIGVIAQEIEEILPELVNTRVNGYKAVDYPKLTPLLIEGIKEQQTTIDKLENENKEQQQQINNLNKRLDKLEKLIS